jgi:hypothetical protein
MKTLTITMWPDKTTLVVSQDGKDIETVTLDKNMLHLLVQSEIELVRDYRINKMNVKLFKRSADFT